jgi:ATP-dependent helicase HepA
LPAVALTSTRGIPWSWESEAVASVGQFVRVHNNELGIGKILRVVSDDLEVEYFDSVAADGRHRTLVNATDVETVQISLQRRCYWLDNGAWRVGRVVWQGDGEYGVRPPDSETDFRVPEVALFVRWALPIADPTAVLVAGGNESPYFHQCRLPFLQSVVAQRAASRGMHGVLSSVVELHDHQLEVVRRVLEDPRQRYLLADEVGLGKTIEAGLIVRQYLLDHPDGHVVVLAPPMLRRQWVAELREKFMIDDFDRAVISVLAHDKPDSWAGGARDTHGRYSRHRDAGLLVIDEVHNLAAGASESASYAALTTLAHAVPRLLLLSATPLLHNEYTFLRMLHLLDPEVYRLEDVDGFRRRVRDRQALGTAFFTFRPDIPAFLLREKVKTLRSMFEADRQFAELLDNVELYLDDGTEVADAVAAARTHISETYRVHRRLLRTRRSDRLVANFPIRGRGRPQPLRDREDIYTEVDDWLEDWREYVRSTLDDEDDATRSATRSALVAFAERSAYIPLLQGCARYRLSPTPRIALEAELPLDTQAALRSWPVDPTERGILERAMSLEAESDATSLLRFLRRNRRRTVVFTTFTTHARHVARLLVLEFGDAAVATHCTDDEPASAEAGLDQFKDPSHACWLLVCDRSAEEGRNLQFADCAVHLDLPLSPNRLEQRIGRLDRYGRGEAIPTLLLDPPTLSIAGAWRRCLTDGFGVFDQSIASLQFAVDVLMPQVIDELLDDGAAGLDAATSGLPERLEGERVAVAEQDALDAIETSGQVGQMTTALDDLEDMWFQFQRSSEGLLCDYAGNLRFHRRIDPDDDRFRSYRLTASGRSPNLNSMPLVAWDVLRTTFQPVVNRPGSYFRRAAVTRPDARLFRVGEPLIDALAGYMRWDDRGQTFAFWRPTHYALDDEAFYRFDYLIDAATEETEDLVGAVAERLDPRAIQRRADSHLPPSLETIWTTLEGFEVLDGETLKVLNRPYDPSTGDLNLNSERRWALDQLVGAADWSSRCHLARVKSEGALRSRDDFEAATVAAVVSFEAASRYATIMKRTRLPVLTTRQRVREEEELEIDERIDRALAAGLRSPRVRLDAIGLVVMSRHLPDGPGFPTAKR